MSKKFTTALSPNIEWPKEVCTAEILPSVTLNLPRWPNRWNRFWHWVFFGVKWKALGGDDE